MNRVYNLRKLLFVSFKFLLLTALFVLVTSCSKSTAVTPGPNPVPIVSPFERRISSGDGDAEERVDGSVNRSSTSLDIVDDPSTSPAQVIGLHFDDIYVPNGATVRSVFVRFTTKEGSFDATDLTIRAQASSNAPPIGSSSFGISVRARTEASVSWSPEDWLTLGDAGLAQTTPNLAPLIQEIIDRPGWQPGNALLLMIEGTGRRVAQSFDSDPAHAPLFHVEFDNSVHIDQFWVEPEPVDFGQEVTFSWSVADSDGDPLSCELDIDDDGVVDYALQDCEAVSSQTHTYQQPGTYIARLTASDDTGASRGKTNLVRVLIPQSVTVAAAGDIACDPANPQFRGGGGTPNHCRMKAVSDLMLDMDLDAVFALGDIQYDDGAYEKFLESYDPSWGRLKDITYPAVGNHEYQVPGAAGYYQYFGEAAGDPTKGYYSFDLGNWHIVVLNSECSQVGGCGEFSPQGQWLKADLAANPTKCALAYWHIPLYSSGGRAEENMRSLWEMLYSAGVDVVLTGHDHTYERFARMDS
ncbi:MAG: metallophosphoesterase, partial [Trueperaceae bacterium]